MWGEMITSKSFEPRDLKFGTVEVSSDDILYSHDQALPGAPFFHLENDQAARLFSVFEHGGVGGLYHTLGIVLAPSQLTAGPTAMERRSNLP